MWVIGNILSEFESDLTDEVIEQTCFLDILSHETNQL
jgi:hypothetical protein